MEFFMRMKLILGVMVLGFTACSNKKTVDTNPVVRDNIIHLSTAIKNVREEMMLSELVDSVSYIPLETNPNCMLGNYQPHAHRYLHKPLDPGSQYGTRTAHSNQNNRI